MKKLPNNLKRRLNLNVLPLRASKIVFCLLLAGCTVGPDYQAPEHQVAQWPDSGLDYETQRSMAELDWREFYPELELQALIEQALLNNLTLKQSIETVRQSARIRTSSDLAVLPVVGANLTGEREKTSALTSTVSSLKDEYALNAGVSWEIDFWGKLARASESALATYEADRASLYAAKISLIAKVAALYYDIQNVMASIELTNANISSRGASRDIAVLRHKQGVISGLDVRQAEVELAQEKIKIPALEKRKQALMYELSVLVAQPPQEQTIGKRVDNLTYLGAIPSGLPADLLKRRPDVIAAERRIQAASAKIGVAKASYFPNIALTGRFGTKSTDFSDLLLSDGKTWKLGGNLTMPLFDWGKISRNVDNAESQYQVALMRYQAQVLEALREVATTLASYHEAFEIYDLQTSLVAATKENLRIARLRYQNGVVSYLDVLDAQRSHASAEVALSSSISAKQIAMVNLYHSLGGGWQTAERQCVYEDEKSLTDRAQEAYNDVVDNDSTNTTVDNEAVRCIEN